MNQFAILAITAIFSSNIVAVAGVGTISLQSEKRSFMYMLVSSICTILPIIISGLAFFAINEYILVPLNATYLKLFIVTLLSVVLAFAVKAILKAVSKEQFFLFEKSYSLPIQTAVCVGTLLITNFNINFYLLMFELAMYCTGFLMVQIIFYGIYDRLDSKQALKPAKNVPLMLYTLSILSMILYAVGLFF